MANLEEGLKGLGSGESKMPKVKNLGFKGTQKKAAKKAVPAKRS